MIPDMAGYGLRIEVPVENIVPQSQTDDLAELIFQSGLGQAHIVGHSIGGVVAILLARRQPDVVKSLINVEGNFTLDDAFWTGTLAAMFIEDIQALPQSYRDDVGGWLRRLDMEPPQERITIADRGLRLQTAATVKAMATLP
ncbi:MAG: alpha/beta fold hydrolase, partial [Terracidiphilus sp.]